ncbi:hypothetical protein ACJMK2_026117 [Sinanodonta woodiana]|uniref:Uncharacterized protein n=1 Tax=Sinanodonta woodiana TaxID=1069815 RepID=A0ABD3XIK8_SINWO
MQLLRKNGISWCRHFSLSAAIRAIPKPKRASLTPFDKRLTVTGKHVNEHVKGGSKEMQKKVALHVEAQCVPQSNTNYRTKPYNKTQEDCSAPAMLSKWKQI